MRVIIAGGGTGGHLFPGIAVAEELRARGGHEVLFVGTARGIEARVVPAEGWPLELVDVSGIKGRGVRGLVAGLGRVPAALASSRALVRRFGADVVVGVGGYASGPVVLAAALGGVPTAILEQNSVPGITNRILGRVVRRVFVSFEESRRFFPADKTCVAGNPLRARLRHAIPAPGARDAASQQNPRLLVLGGSQGAHRLNELVAGAMELLHAEGRPLQLLHQAGAADAEPIAARYHAAGIAAEVRPFIDDMAAAYAAADLVVSRAGATTIAELTAFGRPSLLVPFPHATDDHQTKNARGLVDAGAARLLAEAGATPRALADAIATLAADAALRARMSTAARSLARPDAAAAIVDALLALAR